jgi:hypothetical protein
MIEQSKQSDLKQRLAALLRDLQDGGGQDGEAMAMIGALAGELALSHKQQSWSATKGVMSRQTYNALLEKFRDSGNDNVQAGRIRNAYAIQAVALSLVAATQRDDPQTAEGERLLDVAIDHTVAVYLRNRRQQN